MRVAPLIAFSCLLAAAPIFAGESVATSPASSSSFTKRQLADCMTKRMVSSRTLSYNDASKACKDQLRGNKTDAALSNAPKPVS